MVLQGYSKFSPYDMSKNDLGLGLWRKIPISHKSCDWESATQRVVGWATEARELLVCSLRDHAKTRGSTVVIQYP